MPGVVDNIHVGVAGWSYPDWNGIVYTGRIKDKLRYVAGFVDMVEINNTFYRPPEARNAAAWVKSTEDLPDFYFTAKLHQEVTHEGVILDAMVDAFHRGLEPMLSAGRLKHLLAQFRYDFADRGETRDHLRRIKERLGDLGEMVLELRHVSWQEPEALEFLSGLGVTVANLDYPIAKNSFNLQECRVGTDGYLRLHGRNAAAWFDKDAGRDQTYNYLYSEKEVSGIRDRALSLAKTYRALTIVANNHYEGKQFATAIMLKAMLEGRKLKGPPGVVKRYPELARYAEPEPVAAAKETHETGMLF